MAKWVNLDDCVEISVGDMNFYPVELLGDIYEETIPVVHAHWIRTPSLEDYQSDIECSNCEYDFTVDRICIEDYLRCPHCGAVMDEVVKDEV